MAFLRFVVWIVGTTAGAYALFKIITPDEQGIQQIRRFGNTGDKHEGIINRDLLALPKPPPTTNPFYRPPKPDDSANITKNESPESKSNK